MTNNIDYGAFVRAGAGHEGLDPLPPTRDELDQEERPSGKIVS